MLEKQILEIPVDGNMDQFTDQKMVPAGAALLVQNARRDKLGRISKRFGRELLTSDHDVSDPKALEVGSIVADEAIINKMTANGVYALSEGQNKWVRVSPFVSGAKVKSRFIQKGIYNTFGGSCDFDSASGYFVSAFTERDESTLGNENKTTVVCLIDESGLLKVKKLPVPADFNRALQRVLIVSDSGNIFIHLFHTDSITGITYSVLDIDLNILSSVSIQSNAGKNLHGKFDAVKDATHVYFAYAIDTTLKLRKYDFTGTLVSSLDDTLVDQLGKQDSFGDFGRYGLSVYLTENHFHVFYITSAAGSPYLTSLVGIGYTRSLVASIPAASSDPYEHIVDVAITAEGSTIFAACTFAENTALPKDLRVQYFTTTFTTTYSSFSLPVETYPRLEMLARPIVVNGEPLLPAKTFENDQLTGYVLNLVTGKISAFFSPFAIARSRISNAAFGSAYVGPSNSVLIDGKCYFIGHKIFNTYNSTVFDDDFTGNEGPARFTLDFSNNSSGSRVKIGESNYFTNGPTIELDGRGAHENSFFIHPRIKSAVLNTSGPANPPMQSKTFKYIAVYESFNGKGEITRSIPSQPVTVETAANTTYVDVNVDDIVGNTKFSYDATMSRMNYCATISLYRTIDDGTIYYRVRNIESTFNYSRVTISDRASDDEIKDNQILYTNGGVLSNDSTPISEFSAAGNGRLFLGGLEDEDEIAYSKKNLPGEAVAFSDFERIRIQTSGTSDKSKLSAAGFLDDKFIAFKKSSVSFVAGDGPLETGLDNTFTEPQQISSDAGCDEPRSVINLPDGLMFKSPGKGIYLLNRNLVTEFIGAGVDDYKNERIIASYLLSDKNEVRLLTDGGNVLCFNYLQKKWSVSEAEGAVDADSYKGNEVIAFDDGGVAVERAGIFIDKGAEYYALKYKTPWLKMGAALGVMRVWRVLILGEYKSPHTLVMRAFYNYDNSSYDEYEYTHDPADPVYQWRIHLKRQMCSSMRIEIFDKDQSGSGESYNLSSIQFEAGLKKGSAKLARSKTN